MSRLKRHQQVTNFSTPCFVCLTETNKQNVTTFGCESGKQERPEFYMCEECAIAFEDEANIKLEDYTLSEELYDKLMAWAKMERIYVFMDLRDGPTIKTVADVEEFFDALTGVLVWHPDNPFNDYVDDHGKRTFTDEGATLLDSLMDKCVGIVELEAGKDIYQYAIEACQRAGQLPKPTAGSPQSEPNTRHHVFNPADHCIYCGIHERDIDAGVVRCDGEGKRFILLVGAFREAYFDIPIGAEGGGLVLWDRQENKNVNVLMPDYAQAICLEHDAPTRAPWTEMESWFNGLTNKALESEGIPPTDKYRFPFEPKSAGKFKDFPLDTPTQLKMWMISKWVRNSQGKPHAQREEILSWAIKEANELFGPFFDEVEP